MMILDLLSRTPYHTYGLMREIERSIGFRPPIGMIYPLMKCLHREGLVNIEIQSRGERRLKIYSLTESGVRFVNENRDKIERAKNTFERLKKIRDLGVEKIFTSMRDLYEKIDSLTPDQINRVKILFDYFERELRAVLESGGR